MHLVALGCRERAFREVHDEIAEHDPRIRRIIARDPGPRGPAQDISDPQPQFIRIERFGDKIINPDFQRGEQAFLGLIAGQDDDRRGRPSPNLTRQNQPAFVRQAQVNNDQVHHIALEDRVHVLAGSDLSHPGVLALPRRKRDQGLHGLVTINDQNVTLHLELRDPIADGEVFADTAIVVAHENAKRTIIGEKRPTAVPDITFNDRMTLTLGGKTVELNYVEPSHSDNMIAMNFPAERTLHLVDIATVKRVPYRDLSDSYYPGWINALKFVEGLNFDVLSTSHGPMGVKADIADNRRYHEEMYAAGLAGIRAGQSLDQLKASVTMDAYKDWGQYKAWRPLNVEGVYKRI